MTRILIALLFLSCFATATVSRAAENQNLDSLNFEQQRSRVNKLLDARGKRFGEFSQSLERKTGVFGIFKTKKDMQKSIDILRDIVLTDNNIFVETRKLIDIKDYQSNRNESLALQYDKEISAHMNTITKLRNEIEGKDIALAQMGRSKSSLEGFLYAAGAIILALSIAVARLYRKRKTQI